MIICSTSVDKEGNEREHARRPSHKDVIEAAHWLADRAFGKPVEMVMELDSENEHAEIAKELARELARQTAPCPDTKTKVKTPHNQS